MILKFPSKSIGNKNKKVFNKWLNKNCYRFKYKPVLVQNNCFIFENVNDTVKLYLNFDLPEAGIVFEYKDDIYDLLPIQYIGKLKYDKLKGYFDADRIDGCYTYYQKYEDLIINEVYEEIINFCNENFKKENFIYLITYNTGITETLIGKYEILEKKENLSFRVIKINLLNQT